MVVDGERSEKRILYMYVRTHGWIFNCGFVDISSSGSGIWDTDMIFFEFRRSYPTSFLFSERICVAKAYHILGIGHFYLGIGFRALLAFLHITFYQIYFI